MARGYGDILRGTLIGEEEMPRKRSTETDGEGLWAQIRNPRRRIRSKEQPNGKNEQQTEVDEIELLCLVVRAPPSRNQERVFSPPIQVQ